MGGMGAFPEVLAWLERLKSDGVLDDYAIAGAVAAAMWDEVTATQDMDVAVIVCGGAHALDPLRPVLDWLKTNGYPFDGEHVRVAGVPVQLLPAWHPLIEEGVRQAVDVPYDPDDAVSPVVRVLTPTYLAASWRLPGADSPVRRERAARLRQAGLIDEALMGTLLTRHRL